MISAYKKILDNVVSKNDSRPVLKGVHYENGSMVATDSHQLVLFKDVVEDTKLNVTIDLSTYLPINRDYPEIDRIIPTTHTTQLAFHNLSEISGIVDYLKAGKKQTVDMDIQDSGLSLKLHDNAGMTYDQKAEWSGEALQISFNPSYLYNALAYLDRLYKEQPSDYDGDVTINFTSELRPFTVEFGKMVYVVTPVRNY
jgi:DNA polymerase III sliding clamp (beta) subunit (PCNA family)